MSKGFLLFAHNNSEIDYIRLASICAKRIRKYLNKPVALVTDTPVTSPEFDYVIQIDIEKDNKRNLNNKIQYFHNTSRLDAFRVTPFDQTIIIDVDYIVNSNLLNQFFDNDDSFLMASDVVNLHESENYDRLPGFQMKWATTIYFKKDNISQAIFNQAKLVKENYNFYKELYQFKVGNFRNDYAFTIAEHIIKGTKTSNSLPLINFLVLPQDEIIKVNNDSITCIVNNVPCVFKGTDLHFFNKQTILDFEKDLV